MTASQRLPHSTLSSQLEESIRSDIIAGVFAPGERLRILDLTDRYGVSATPLREALRRLSAESLVELDPRYGATVAGISSADLHDTYWLLDHLEGMALERAISFGDAAWEERVRTAWERFEIAARVEEGGPADAIVPSTPHEEFHNALLSACQSPWLLRSVGNLALHAERYRLLSAHQHRRHSVDEHREIMARSLERNAVAAVASLRGHLARTVEMVEPLVTGSPEPDTTPVTP